MLVILGMLYGIYRNKNNSVMSMIYSFVTLGFIITAIVKGLSFFDLLTREAICIIWLCLFSMIGFIFIKMYKDKQIIKKLKDIKIDFKLTLDLQHMIIYFITFMLIITFVASLFTVVNNGDSMSYHLVRLPHWLQKKSTDLFFTNDIRQILYPTFSEYWLLQIYALDHSDFELNLLQWISYLMNSMMIYQICRKLGIEKLYSLLGSLLFLTMPLAIAESMTTQVDLFGTMWCLFFIYMVIDFLDAETISVFHNRENLIRIVAASACVGFAFLAKSNACFMLIPFCLWLFGARIKRESFGGITSAIVTAVIIVLLLIAPDVYSMLSYRGDTLENSSYSDLFVGSFSPKFLILNLYKNISMELMQHVFLGINDIILKMGTLLSHLLKVDINDPLIGFGAQNYLDTASSEYWYFHHDHAGNALVTGLSIFSIPVFLQKKMRRQKDKVWYFSMCVFGGFLISAIVIRWQPWVTRLLLPSAILLVIPCAYAMQSIGKKMKERKSFLMGSLFCAIIIITINSLAYNVRPAVSNLFSNKSRYELYFYYHDESFESYQWVTNYIKDKNHQSVGLVSSNFEYAIWSELNEDAVIEHVNLEEPSSTSDFKPTCIIVRASDYSENDIVEYLGEKYSFVSGQNGDLTLGILELGG